MDSEPVEIKILSEETVDTPLFNPNLLRELDETLKKLQLKPGQFIGHIPAHSIEFRSHNEPFCVAESFLNCLISSGFSVPQISKMLGLQPGEQEYEIIKHLHTVIGQAGEDDLTHFSSGIGNSDAIGRIVEELTDKGLIKSSRVYVGAGTDPTKIFMEMVRGHAKTVYISGAERHAVALVGEMVHVDNSSGAASPIATIFEVDPLDTSTVTTTLSTPETILGQMSRGGPGVPTFRDKPLKNLIEKWRNEAQQATNDPNSCFMVVTVNCYR